MPKKLQAVALLSVIAGMVFLPFSSHAQGIVCRQSTGEFFSAYHDYARSRMFYQQKEGKNDLTVVFLHGFGENVRTWEPVLSFWEGEDSLVVVDLPGQGRSHPERRENYSHRNQALLLSRFISEQDWEDVVLVGHSMGANLALRTALSLPERVAGIVLLSPAVYSTRGVPFGRLLVDFPLTRLVTGTLIRRLVRSPERLTDVLRDSVYDPHMVDKHMIERLVEPIVENPRSHLALLYLVRDSGRNHLLPDFSILETPVLILHGADDPLIPLRHAERLYQVLPNALVEVLKRCGHLPHEEKPERVAVLIGEFLRTVPAHEARLTAR